MTAGYRAECMCGEVMLVDSMTTWRAFEHHLEICDLVASTTPPSASDEDRAPLGGTPGADGSPTPGAGSTAPSGVSGERVLLPGRRRRRRVIAEGMRLARIDQLGDIAANATRLIVETEDYLRRAR